MWTWACQVCFPVRFSLYCRTSASWWTVWCICLNVKSPFFNVEQCFNSFSSCSILNSPYCISSTNALSCFCMLYLGGEVSVEYALVVQVLQPPGDVQGQTNPDAPRQMKITVQQLLQVPSIYVLQTQEPLSTIGFGLDINTAFSVEWTYHPHSFHTQHSIYFAYFILYQYLIFLCNRAKSMKSYMVFVVRYLRYLFHFSST